MLQRHGGERDEAVRVRRAGLGEQMPARTATDYEAMLSRLRGTAALVDQTIAAMKEGLRRGVTPPEITLRNVVAQADAILVEDPATSPLLTAFQKIPETVPADRREAVRVEAATLLKDQSLPAFRRLRDFLASEYVPNCRDSLAAGALPDGPDWYAYLVAQSTTTRLTPKQIHEIGLAAGDRGRRPVGPSIVLPQDADFRGELRELLKEIVPVELEEPLQARALRSLAGFGDHALDPGAEGVRGRAAPEHARSEPRATAARRRRRSHPAL